MLNGAYFTPSGAGASASYARASSLGAKSSSMVGTITSGAGVLGCRRGHQCQHTLCPLYINQHKSKTKSFLLHHLFLFFPFQIMIDPTLYPYYSDCLPINYHHSSIQIGKCTFFTHVYLPHLPHPTSFPLLLNLRLLQSKNNAILGAGAEALSNLFSFLFCFCSTRILLILPCPNHNSLSIYLLSGLKSTEIVLPFILHRN